MASHNQQQQQVTTPPARQPTAPPRHRPATHPQVVDEKGEVLYEFKDPGICAVANFHDVLAAL